jgi:hypothetical protein
MFLSPAPAGNGIVSAVTTVDAVTGRNYSMSPLAIVSCIVSCRGYRELGPPPRVTDWPDDHRIRAVSLRGEDAVGVLVVGSASLARFLRWTPREVPAADYPALAQGSARDASGSSAGGERVRIFPSPPPGERAG